MMPHVQNNDTSYSFPIDIRKASVFLYIRKEPSINKFGLEITYLNLNSNRQGDNITYQSRTCFLSSAKAM